MMLILLQVTYLLLLLLHGHLHVPAIFKVLAVGDKVLHLVASARRLSALPFCQIVMIARLLRVLRSEDVAMRAARLLSA